MTTPPSYSGRRRLLVTLAPLLVVALSCSEREVEITIADSTDPASVSMTTAVTVVMDEPRPTTIVEDNGDGDGDGDGEAVEPIFEDFGAAVFSNSTAIDNEWLPLAPGNRLVLNGTTLEDGEETSHRIEFIVTGLTKEIAGVETVVVWIEDYSDNELVEAELAFYAQDDIGNVWFLGEYPEEYEEGEFIAAPAWIAGLEEAQAGIKMYASPELGLAAYFQGWGPAVEWSDFGLVDAVDQQTCVVLACYDDVLVIAESSLDEEGAFQLKSYARGVGNIQVDFRGDDLNQEQLEVVEFGPISTTQLDQYHAAALVMEAHAYEISPGVYGQTSPLELATG